MADYLTAREPAIASVRWSMAFQASKALMELRVHLCQSSPASKGIRCAPVLNC